MQRLRRINRWCLAHAGVTAWEWILCAAAFAAIVFGFGLLGGLAPR